MGEEGEAQVVAGADTAQLVAMFAIAVREGAVGRNPVRDVEPVRVQSAAREVTRALTREELENLLGELDTSQVPLPVLKGAKRDVTKRTVSQWARDVDLLDPVVMLAGTGLRRSELLGLRWDDYVADLGTITVTGHVRGKSTGLVREPATKTVTSARTILVPDFVAEMLARRGQDPQRAASSEEAGVIFASTVGTLRDPDNLSQKWRRVREAIGFGWVGYAHVSSYGGGVVCPRRCGPSGAFECVDDAQTAITRGSGFIVPRRRRSACLTCA